MIRAFAIVAAFAALILIADRTIAGFVQCDAAQTCPRRIP